MVAKSMPLFLQDNEPTGKRKYCFTVQLDTGEDAFFSVELESDLALWEKAFQKATFLEVQRIQVGPSPIFFTERNLR